MVSMTYIKGFMSLQNPMRVYHLCVGCSDASEGYIEQRNGIYILFGGDYSAYDLPGGVYDTSEWVYWAIEWC